MVPNVAFAIGVVAMPGMLIVVATTIGVVAIPGMLIVVPATVVPAVVVVTVVVTVVQVTVVQPAGTVWESNGPVRCPREKGSCGGPLTPSLQCRAGTGLNQLPPKYMCTTPLDSLENWWMSSKSQSRLPYGEKKSGVAAVVVVIVVFVVVVDDVVVLVVVLVVVVDVVVVGRVNLKVSSAASDL